MRTCRAIVVLRGESTGDIASITGVVGDAFWSAGISDDDDEEEEGNDTTTAADDDDADDDDDWMIFVARP